MFLSQIFFSYIFYPIFPFEQVNNKALATDLQVLSSLSIVQCICIKDHVINKVDYGGIVQMWFHVTPARYIILKIVKCSTKDGQQTFGDKILLLEDGEVCKDIKGCVLFSYIHNMILYYFKNTKYLYNTKICLIIKPLIITN